MKNWNSVLLLHFRAIIFFHAHYLAHSHLELVKFIWNYAGTRYRSRSRSPRIRHFYCHWMIASSLTAHTSHTWKYITSRNRQHTTTFAIESNTCNKKKIAEHKNWITRTCDGDEPTKNGTNERNIQKKKRNEKLIKRLSYLHSCDNSDSTKHIVESGWLGRGRVLVWVYSAGFRFGVSGWHFTVSFVCAPSVFFLSFCFCFLVVSVRLCRFCVTIAYLSANHYTQARPPTQGATFKLPWSFFLLLFTCIAFVVLCRLLVACHLSHRRFSSSSESEIIAVFAQRISTLLHHSIWATTMKWN